MSDESPAAAAGPGNAARSGTLPAAAWAVGGDAWRTWREAVRTAVVDHQRHGGCENGSVDPADPFGNEGGRVYSTAMAALALLAPGRTTSLDPPKARK